MGSRVAVALESTVNDVGSVVVHVWHDWLVHAAVPRNVARLSEPVSVNVLVSHVENRVLTGPPLAMCIWHWWVLRQHAGHIPVEEIGVVSECLSMESVIVHNNWTVAL